MATQTGRGGPMFRALAEKGINIQMITTSEIKISTLVSREEHLKACAVRQAFELDALAGCGPQSRFAACRMRDAVDVERLRR